MSRTRTFQAITLADHPHLTRAAMVELAAWFADMPEADVESLMEDRFHVTEHAHEEFWIKDVSPFPSGNAIELAATDRPVPFDEDAETVRAILASYGIDTHFRFFVAPVAGAGGYRDTYIPGMEIHSTGADDDDHPYVNRRQVEQVLSQVPAEHVGAQLLALMDAEVSPRPRTVSQESAVQRGREAVTAMLAVEGWTGLHISAEEQRDIPYVETGECTLGLNSPREAGLLHEPAGVWLCDAGDGQWHVSDLTVECRPEIVLDWAKSVCEAVVS